MWWIWTEEKLNKAELNNLKSNWVCLIKEIPAERHWNCIWGATDIEGHWERESSKEGRSWGALYTNISPFETDCKWQANDSSRSWQIRTIKSANSYKSEEASLSLTWPMSSSFMSQGTKWKCIFHSGIINSPLFVFRQYTSSYILWFSEQILIGAQIPLLTMSSKFVFVVFFALLAAWLNFLSSKNSWAEAIFYILFISLLNRRLPNLASVAKRDWVYCWQGSLDRCFCGLWWFCRLSQ